MKSGSVLLVWMAMGACGRVELAGNSVETENSVAARVLLVDSLLSSSTAAGDSPTVATLRLDSANFDFDSSGADGSDLGMEKMDGSPIPFEIVYWVPPKKSGRLRVRIDSDLRRAGSRIRLLWNLPHGHGSASPAVVWKDIPDSVRLALNSVVVSDFEAGENISLLPTKTLWRAESPDSTLVTSIGFPADDSGRSGKALHVKFQAKAPQLVFATINLVALGVPRSLRSLDSLVLYARGSGNLTVAFANSRPTPGRPNPSRAIFASALQGPWTRIRIRPADLAAGDGVAGNLGWAGVRDGVATLAFYATDGTDLWLDDLRLFGVDQDDFKP